MRSGAICSRSDVGLHGVLVTGREHRDGALLTERGHAKSGRRDGQRNDRDVQLACSHRVDKLEAGPRLHRRLEGWACWRQDAAEFGGCWPAGRLGRSRSAAHGPAGRWRCGPPAVPPLPGGALGVPPGAWRPLRPSGQRCAACGQTAAPRARPRACGPALRPRAERRAVALRPGGNAAPRRLRRSI